jgi:solute carrier family 25 oxoglutarate transporter 11
MIGLVTTYFQQYITNFINSSKLLAKHYEPPVNATQYKTWFNAVTSLESFNKTMRDARQLALFGAFFDIGLKLAAFRQFNSGWQSNFGGFEYSYYRKIPTIFGSFLVTSPFAVAGDMVLRAYHADRTFPRDLQKGYTSYFNAFRRIPFEEGPYYLFRNTLPLYIKHTLLPFTSFYSYDWLVDKLSVIWRTTDNPIAPVKIFCAGLATYLGARVFVPLRARGPRHGGLLAQEGRRGPLERQLPQGHLLSVVRAPLGTSASRGSSTATSGTSSPCTSPRSCSPTSSACSATGASTSCPAPETTPPRTATFD